MFDYIDTQSETLINDDYEQIRIKFSIEMNSNQSGTELIYIKFSIRINPKTDSFGFTWIYSDWKFGLNQSESGLSHFESD